MEKIIEAVKATLAVDDFNRYAINLKDGYSLSILTGSHVESAELQTIEVALMNNHRFAFGEDSDEAIIHYMSWSLFLDFIGDMSSWNEGKLDKTIEDIFKQYQKWSYEMLSLSNLSDH